MAENDKELRWGKNTRIENKKYAKIQLIMAAYDNFSKNGVDNTTIEDIAGSAKVSRGTFYQYFKGKKEIRRLVFEAIAQEFFDELSNFAKEGPANPVKLIEELIVFTAQYQCFSKYNEKVRENYDHDLLCAVPFVLEDEWKEGWRNVLYNSTLIKAQENLKKSDVSSLAEVAGILALGCRQFKIKVEDIRNSSETFQLYSAHD